MVGGGGGWRGHALCTFTGSDICMCNTHTHVFLWLSLIIRGDVETIGHQSRKPPFIMFSYVTTTVGQLSQMLQLVFHRLYTTWRTTPLKCAYRVNYNNLYPARANIVKVTCGCYYKIFLGGHKHMKLFSRDKDS